MTRRRVLLGGVVVIGLGVSQMSPPVRAGQAAPAQTFSVVEASIADMAEAMASGQVTARDIVQQYLARIAVYDGMLRASLTVNPRALLEADARDRERARGVVRGPLHGIPVALKDNIQTRAMRTTGGALAFADLVPPYDASLVTHLETAGAIIIAKTSLTELANWVAAWMPNHYNAVAGFGMNPYDPRPDPRTATVDRRPALDPGGSSSGIGTAASLWAANVGTETSGSILTPSNALMLVGIKPTVGRISRHGVIPITSDQDTPGPMARSVADAAALLGVLEGAGADPNDPATGRCSAVGPEGYTASLDASALRGARIGIPRAFFYERVATAEGPRGGLAGQRLALMEEAIALLRRQGAEVVDPVELPSIVDPDPSRNILSWSVCSAPGDGREADRHCSVVLKYGMKRDFNRWLASLGDVPVPHTLGALRAWNREHEGAGAIRYGQAQLDLSDEMDIDRDQTRYRADREKDLFLSRTHGIDAALSASRLDALLFPGPTGAGIAARAGYPTVAVPFGFVDNVASPQSFPAGFAARPAPYGVSFTGTACSEARLIGLAFAFEQASRRRVPPAGFP